MIIRNHDLKDKPLAWWCIVSCNNVAPVTNFVSAELQRGPIRHNEAKIKLQLKQKSHYLRFKHFIITITDDPSPC